MQFCWTAYLRQCNSEAVPDTAFIQVEKSLTSGIEPLQIVEILQNAKVPLDYFTDIVNHKKDGKVPTFQPDTISTSSPGQPRPVLKSIITNGKQILPTSGKCPIEKNNKYVSVTSFWIAQVTTVCGPLLRVRYVLPKGYSASEFWVQVGSRELQHVGYGDQNGLVPVLPASVVPCAGGENKTEGFKRDVKDELNADDKIIYSNGTKMHLNYSSSFSHDSAANIVHFLAYTTSCHVPVATEALVESTRPYFKRIHPGKYVEVLRNTSSKRGWPSIVLKNVGGRLLLRHACCVSTGSVQGSGNDLASTQAASSVVLEGTATNKEVVDMSIRTTTKDTFNSTAKTETPCCSSAQNITINASVQNTRTELTDVTQSSIMNQDTRIKTPPQDDKNSMPMQDTNNSSTHDVKESASLQGITSAPIQDTTSSSVLDRISDVPKHDTICCTSAQYTKNTTSIQDTTCSTSIQDTTCSVSMQDTTCSMLIEDIPSSPPKQDITNCTLKEKCNSSCTSTLNITCSSVQDSTSSTATVASPNQVSLDRPTSILIQDSSCSLAAHDVLSSKITTHDTSSVSMKVILGATPSSVTLGVSSSATSQNDITRVHATATTADTLVKQGQDSGSQVRHEPSPFARASNEIPSAADAHSDLVTNGVIQDASVNREENRNPFISEEPQDAVKEVRDGTNSSLSKNDEHCASDCGKVTEIDSSSMSDTQDRLNCRKVAQCSSSHTTEAEVTCPKNDSTINVLVCSVDKEHFSGSKDAPKGGSATNSLTQIISIRDKPGQDSSADSCATLSSSLCNITSHTSLATSSKSEHFSICNPSSQAKTDQCITTLFESTCSSEAFKDNSTKVSTEGSHSTQGEIDGKSIPSDSKASSVFAAVTANEAACSETSKDGNPTTASCVLHNVSDVSPCSPSASCDVSSQKEFWLFCTSERLRNLNWRTSPGWQCYRHELSSDQANDEILSCVWSDCDVEPVAVPLPVGNPPTTGECSSQQGELLQRVNSSKLEPSAFDDVVKMEVDCTDNCGEALSDDGKMVSKNSSFGCGSLVSLSVIETDSKLIPKVSLEKPKVEPDMVLEVIHPRRLCCVHAALVTKVHNDDQIEVRFDACKNDEALLAEGNQDRKEHRDAGDTLLSADAPNHQKKQKEMDLDTKDLFFDKLSLQWRWKIHLRDFRLLPAGFCSQYSIPLHPLLEVENHGDASREVETMTPYNTSTDHPTTNDISSVLKPEVKQEFCNSGRNEESVSEHCTQCIRNESPLKSKNPTDSCSLQSSSNSQHSPSQSKSLSSEGVKDAILPPPGQEDCSAKKITDVTPGQSLIKIETNEFTQENINEIVAIDVEIVEKLLNKVEKMDTSLIKTEAVEDKTVSSTSLNNIVSNDEDQIEKVTLLVDDSALCTVGDQEEMEDLCQRRRCPSDPNVKFSWNCSPWSSSPTYLAAVKCPMAGELGFSEYQKLEVVHPRHPSMLCVATIVAITGHLLWISLDSKDDQNVSSVSAQVENKNLPSSKGSPEHILSHISCSCHQKSVVVVHPCDSDEIFPPGWAQSHDAIFRAPCSCRPMDHEMDQNAPRAISSSPTTQTPAPPLNDLASFSRWCPELHLHHTCSPGPFLSRTKLACQPGLAVAGPVASVLKQVVAQSLAAGFCPTKLTKDLTAALQKVALPDWALMDIKAKCKRYSVRGTVLAPATRRDVPVFLEQLRAVLQCCPNLWSHIKRAVCPYHCKQPVPVAASTGRRRRAALPLSVSLLGATRQPGDEDLEEDDDDGDDDATPAAEWGDEGVVDPCEDEVDTSWLRSSIRSGDGSLKRARNENSRTDAVEVASKKRKVNRTWAIPPAEVVNDPLMWTVTDVYEYVSKDPSVCHHASWLRRERVDGRALLLLNLTTLVYHLQLPHRALLPLAHLLCRLKMAHLLKRGVE